ncbi:MAG: L-seryl-tRNA(Sec) selenium transferase [Acidobacteria bacterium]|nr:L-seryl-tRNA(Sec) selenium transferase [Acidobacteriota bacterium]
MPQVSPHADFRVLPSVDEVLKDPAVATLEFPRALVVAAVREVLADLRQVVGEKRSVQDRLARLGAEVGERVRRITTLSLRPVINATGVVLHTNLGRAPLSASAIEAICQTAGAYSNLEYDLDAGARGKRDVHAAALLERLLGAPAVVVNNNAAAIFLALHELAARGEVVVSRGELIEIGEGFRIPDVLARSGARLREVGTTNRTRIEDYRAAINDQTRVLLRVHRSNFKIVGFTERPTLAELVELGHQTGLPVVEDLGSGCLVDLTRYGLDSEPQVGESIAAGVDVVTFSGDKLLGGPQAGILAGKREWIARIRRNPMFRALRVDKLTYAVLGATLRDYLLESYDHIPILAMLSQTEAQIRDRAAKLLASLHGIRGELASGRSVIGGGSTPAMELPTTLLALHPPPGVSAATCERRLRTGFTPVVARVEDERVLVDLRTVLPDQESSLAEMLKQVWT